MTKVGTGYVDHSVLVICVTRYLPGNKMVKISTAIGGDTTIGGVQRAVENAFGKGAMTQLRLRFNFTPGDQYIYFDVYGNDDGEQTKKDKDSARP